MTCLQSEVWKAGIVGRGIPGPHRTMGCTLPGPLCSLRVLCSNRDGASPTSGAHTQCTHLVHTSCAQFWCPHPVSTTGADSGCPHLVNSAGLWQILQQSCPLLLLPGGGSFPITSLSVRNILFSSTKLQLHGVGADVPERKPLSCSKPCPRAHCWASVLPCSSCSSSSSQVLSNPCGWED